jgi:hypothetical protein
MMVSCFVRDRLRTFLVLLGFRQNCLKAHKKMTTPTCTYVECSYIHNGVSSHEKGEAANSLSRLQCSGGVGYERRRTDKNEASSCQDEPLKGLERKWLIKAELY